MLAAADSANLLGQLSIQYCLFSLSGFALHQQSYMHSLIYKQVLAIIVMDLDDSSLSAEDRPDQKYIKKSILPRVYQKIDIVGDPVSSDSRSEGEFKQLASDQDGFNSDEKQKSEEQHQNSHQIQQSRPNQLVVQQKRPQIEAAIRDQEMRREAQEFQNQHQRVQLSANHLDHQYNIGELQSLEKKEAKEPEILKESQKRHSNKLISLDQYEGEIQNPISIDPQYQQYIRMQQEKRNNNSKQDQIKPAQHLSQPQKQEPLIVPVPQLQVKQEVGQQPNQQLKQEQVLQKLLQQQPKMQAKQQLQQKPIQHLYQEQIQPKVNQNKVPHQQLIQPAHQEAKLQQQRKKLKQLDSSISTSGDHLKYMKDVIVREVKEQLRAMKTQKVELQRQYEGRIVQRLENVLKVQIQEKMNEYQSQNFRQQISLRNLTQKMLQSMAKMNKRFQNLQRQIDKIDKKLS